jgi:hypothetical protein
MSDVNRRLFTRVSLSFQSAAPDLSLAHSHSTSKGIFSSFSPHPPIFTCIMRRFNQRLESERRNRTPEIRAKQSQRLTMGSESE